MFVIHICGASGSGTTTLANVICERFGFLHLDTDDFFWEPTDPPFTTKRTSELRQKLLAEAIESSERCVISGSLCDWGDIFISKFNLVIYLHTDTSIRIERLRAREFSNFGARILPGGDMYEAHDVFIRWAAAYDTGGLEIRSAMMHREWLKLCSCPVIKLDGASNIQENLKSITYREDFKDAFYKKESEMFNLSSDYYDKYRPSYPREIIQTLIREANISENSLILEIGAGSGKATELLADISCSITCVDPGPDLVAKGKEKFKKYPKISFNCSRYENFEGKADFYDLICAFQAFHWVPQPIGFQKCAKELKEAGFLALIWNMYITYDNDLDNELMQISYKYGGLADFVSADKCEDKIASIVKSIEDSTLFSEVKVFKHFWQQSYTADEYFMFCLTGNSFTQKSDEEKKSAYEDIRRLAQKHGGVITRPYLCALYLTAKR